MGTDQNDAAGADSGTGWVLDARGGQGMQFGHYNTQVNIDARTWITDAVRAPLRDKISGAIESPYRGLKCYTEHDAALFFGRESAIDAVLEVLSQRVREPAILLVSGVSGAGKSSLLRAGVVPRLRATGLKGTAGAHEWPCLLFTPGKDPLDALAGSIAQAAQVSASAVRRDLDIDPAGFALTAAQAAGPPEAAGGAPGRRALLVIDQFEQLFTQCGDNTQRAGFVTALQAAVVAKAALVVLVVRADFESRCEDYPQLIDAVQNRYRVTAMTDEQLAMAITEPAKQAGYRVDDDLRDRLLREIRSRTIGTTETGGQIPSVAGVLPLLSHALDTAWRARAGNTLTVADYERSGRIGGAVARSASRTFNALPDHRRVVARQVFTRLAVAAGDGTDTADCVPRTDLARIPGSRADVDAVLEAFAAERLLTLGSGTVEVSHEIVLREWPLLRDVWLAETHNTRAVCTRLRTAAAEWNSRGHDAAYLYSGSVLDTAVAAADRVAAAPGRYPELGDTEHEFLAAATRAGKRRTRQNRTAAGAVLLLIVVLTATMITAFDLREREAVQRELAVVRDLISQSELLATGDPFGSKLSAVAAWRLSESREAEAAMLKAAANPHLAVLASQNGPVNGVAFSPKDGTLATTAGDSANEDERLRLWGVAGHKKIDEPLTGHTRFAWAVAFSPDGSKLATSSDDGVVLLWDVAGRKQIGGPLTGHRGGVYAVAFSPDGSTLATGGWDNTVRLWDTAAHKQIGDALTGHDERGALSGVVAVAFSFDGSKLATGGEDGTVRLWDVTSRKQIGAPLTGHTGAVRTVVFGAESSKLVTSGDDGTVRLWDVAGHKQDGALTGHPGAIRAMAFHHDHRTLVTGGEDGTVRLWDVKDRTQIGAPLTGHTGAVRAVAFDRDSHTLATGSTDGTVRLWDAASRGIPNPLIGLTDGGKGVRAMAFSSDGSIGTGEDIPSEDAPSEGDNGEVQRWNTESSTPIPLTRNTSVTVDSYRGVRAVAFNNDGSMLAIGDHHTAWLWNITDQQQSGDPLTDYEDDYDYYDYYDDHPVNSVAFSPDGSKLATGGDNDQQVRLWDVADHELITTFTGHKGQIHSAAFNHDGSMLATGSDDGTVRLWDVASRNPDSIRVLPVPGGRVGAVAFSTDGSMLATGSKDGVARLWDTADLTQIGDPLTGHNGPVRVVAFSGDSSILATGSEDHTARLWAVGSQQQIGDPLTGHNGPVLAVAFIRDGSMLTGGGDGTVRRWDTGFLADPLHFLCTWADGNFTPDAWNHYITGAEYQQPCR